MQQYRALLFLKLTDPLRFGQALAELKNHNLISKKSQYPTDLLTALKLLTKFETEKPQYFRRPPPRDQDQDAGGDSLNQEGVAFFGNTPNCYFCLGPHGVKVCPLCNPTIVKEIYEHRNAGNYVWPKQGQKWTCPPPPIGVGGAQSTGVGGIVNDECQCQ